MHWSVFCLLSVDVLATTVLPNSRGGGGRRVGCEEAVDGCWCWWVKGGGGIEGRCR